MTESEGMTSAQCRTPRPHNSEHLDIRTSDSFVVRHWSFNALPHFKLAARDARLIIRGMLTFFWFEAWTFPFMPCGPYKNSWVRRSRGNEAQIFLDCSREFRGFSPRFLFFQRRVVASV